MEEKRSVEITVLTVPTKKLVVKLVEEANDYFDFVQLGNFDVYDTLLGIKKHVGDPFTCFIPKELSPSKSTAYCQAIEVSLDFTEDELIEGFNLIELESFDAIEFQGSPFEDTMFNEAYQEFEEVIEEFKPESLGYKYDSSLIRMKFEPAESHGYREIIPITKIA